MLILVVHGSPAAGWRVSVERLTEALRADLGQNTVRLAYLKHTAPTVMDVASDAVQAGVKRIRVLPLFLAGEGHVARDLHPLIDRIRKTHRPLEVQLLPPVGEHPLFRELLGRIAVEEAE
jgi:sirohydrochlorin cobaltochelatase